MNQPESPKTERSAADLARQLAEQELADLPPDDPGSSTIAHLKGELDTIAEGLREPPPVDEFEDESQCGQALTFVKAIGRDASVSAASSTYPTPSSDANLGRLGQYELISKLGEGGMGTVYKARHTKLDKIVAIKVLPPERMKDHAAVSRFEREMRAVGKLEHPNIVRAMDAGEVEGKHFLVMEYVNGVDLSQLSKQLGPLPIAESCELIRQAAIGLDEAHDHEMVHRDIKPSNLILAQRRRKPPVVKILDMGLAMLSEAHSPEVQGLTNTGQVMGTIDYMAPEQGGDSKNVDTRADIYALGASMYRLLCGEVIFHGDNYQSPVQKLMALATKPIPPIQERRAGVPDELAAIVHRMLEKDPTRRFATPQEVADALAPFSANADSSSLLGRTLPVGAGETTSTFEPTIDSGSGAAAGTAPTIDVSAGGATEAVSQTPKATVSFQVPTKNQTREYQTASGSVQPTSARPQTAARRKLPRWLSIAIAAGLGAIVLATIVLLLPSKNGTIRIEINDPEIEVTVGENGYTIKGAGEKEISLEPGEHLLTVKRGDDFDFQTDKFVLSKGDTVVLNVEYIKDAITVRMGETVIGQNSIPRTEEPPVVAAGNPKKTEYALAFDGHDDYVDIPTLKIPAGPLTIEAIVELESLPGQSKLANIVSDSGGAFYLTANSSDGFTFLLSKGRQQFACQLPNTSALKKRVYVRATLDGKNVVLSANDKRFSNPFDTAEGTRGNIVLGINPKIRSCFHGALHQLRISNVARNTPSTDAPASLEPDESDNHTLALYHFDEGHGEELKDSSGNSHHGKIVGAKWIRASSEGPTTVADNDSIQPTQWTPIFNGRDLAGWEVEGEGEWTVTDGVISGTGGRLVYTAKEFADVEVRVECRNREPTNSGVHLRTRFGRGWKVGYEAQISNSPGQRTNTGGIYGIADVKRQLVADDTWFTMEFRADGDRLALKINGEKTAEATDNQFKSGQISLQAQGGPVYFRNIEIRLPIDNPSDDSPPLAKAPFDAKQAQAHQAAWAIYLGVPVEFTNKLGMKFALIPPGTFLMGSPQQEERRLPNESKQYTATLSKPFYMCVTEVTQQQYTELMGKNPSYLSSTGGWKERVEGLDTSQHPVVSIRWSEAIDFCNKLSEHESVEPHYLRDGDRVSDQAGEGYRLPTEAEWEFACRAGTTTPFHFGATISTDEANYDGMYAYGDGKTGEDLDRSTPVASFPSNAFDLFDMHGNVWEFCWDWLADYPTGTATDYRGPDSGKERLIRGGSWDNHVPDLRSARRGGSSPGGTGAVVGFRICLSVDAIGSTTKRPSLGKAPFDATQAKAHQQAWAKHLGLPVEKEVELAGGEKMTFLLIPPGEFMMGSSDAQRADFLVEAATAESSGNLDRIPFEAPQHPVRISQPFYMGKFEVTQAQWEAVIGNNPSKFKHPANPVENISWHDVQLLLAKVNQHVPLGFRFVLPTEAQWEYACRAGTTTAWCFGNDDSVVQNFAYVRANAPDGPKAVGQLRPNAWNLHDMHGNVWEWCADWFAENYYENSLIIDPSGPSTGSMRVDRGGGWSYDARDCRSAYRNRSAPDARADVIGFRLAMTIDTAELKSTDTVDADPHHAAEWVLGVGGKIHFGSEVFTSIKDLPNQPSGKTTVDLSGTQVSADKLRLLAALTELEGLDLRQSSIDDAGLESVATSKGLVWISLAHAANVTDAGLEHLKKLPFLRELNLEGTSIREFSQLDGLTSLKHLSLIFTPISNNELALLSNLKQLDQLNLKSTDVDDKGLEHLKGLTNLRNLHVTQTRVTPAGAQVLSRALPECNIHFTVDGREQVMRDGMPVSP